MGHPKKSNSGKVDPRFKILFSMSFFAIKCCKKCRMLFYVLKRKINITFYVEYNVDGGVKVTQQQRPTIYMTLLCIAAIIQTELYAYGLLPNGSLAAVEIFCAAAAAAEILAGLTDEVNRRKMLYFGFGIVICAITWAINPPEAFSLSGRGLPFAILLLFSMICFAVVGIRLLLWSQPQWEETQQFRQEQRRALQEYIQNRAKARRSYQSNQIEQERNYKAQSKVAKRKNCLEQEQLEQNGKLKRQKSRQDSELIRQELQQDAQKVHLENALRAGASTPMRQSCGPKWWRNPRFLCNIALSFAIFLGFFLIPVIVKLLIHDITWIQAVVKLVSLINGGNRPASEIQAVVYYFIFYLIGLYVLFGIFRVAAYLLLGRDVDPAPVFMPRVLKHYQMPGAILALGWFIVHILSGNDPTIRLLSGLWNELLTVCLVLLVTLVAVDIVDIFTKQCLESESLFRKMIRLIFVSVLDVLANLLLGVLTALNFRLIISSLVAVIFPESENAVHHHIQRVLQKMFREDLNQTSAKGKRQGSFSANGVAHRIRIWKRK